MIALLFSGVGSISANTANLRALVKSMPIYGAVQTCLSEKYQLNLDDMWTRVSQLEQGGSLNSAVDEIIIQMLVQLSGAAIASSASAEDTEIVCVGHSIGEIAAAVHAGFLSVQEAVDVAVSLGRATEKKRGALWYGPVKEGQDEVASLNIVEASGDRIGAIAVVEGAESDYEVTHKQVKTQFPWHHSSYEQIATLESSANAQGSESKRLPLYLSLAGGKVSDNTLDSTYWSKWVWNGVNLHKTLCAVQTSSSQVTKVVELSAHPLLEGAVTCVFQDKAKYLAMFDRENGFRQSCRSELANATLDKGLQKAIFDSVKGKSLDLTETWTVNGLSSYELVATAAQLSASGAFPMLQPQDLYRFVTPQDLIEHYSRVNATLAGQPAIRSASKADKNRVVIQAISCQLPGNLNTARQLGAFTSTQGDAVRCDPSFDKGEQPAGYLGEIAIEYAKFGLSKNEIATMDPQQALVLNCVDKLLEEHDIVQLPAKTGVYIGAWNQEFDGDRSSVFYPTGTNQSLVAARVSHVYRLHGPCKVVNSACASSLEAILEAFRDVQEGRVDCAIAGGVNLIWDPAFTKCMSQSGFLGKGGRCRTFEANADGYVRSEGCGLVLLTRMEECPEGKFYAEILGGASNHNGGRSASLTAPSPFAQEDCIVEALADAGLQASQVDFIECHGTGTKIGDPIEFSALSKTVGKDRNAGQPCYLASVKSNIGHLESAAGVAGLIHAVTVLSNKEVPLMGNFRQANPLLESCDGLRFAEKGNIKAPHLRVAGISSFGFGGSNVHLIIRGVDELPPSNAPVAAKSRADLFVFDRSASVARAAAAATRKEVVYVEHQPVAQQYQPSIQQSSNIGEQDQRREATLNLFWSVVHGVAADAHPEEEILRSGVDSLGLTELFLQIEQKLGVEAAELSSFLSGEHLWKDLAERIVGSATVSVPLPVKTASPSCASDACCLPDSPRRVPAVKKQTARAPASETEDRSLPFYTWPKPRFNGIRTTHVGSLPRPKDKDGAIKDLNIIIRKQLELGISIINDGESGRIDYAGAVLERMTGFTDQDEITAAQPQDLQDLPCVARRFLVRAGLITLNPTVKTCNPHCIGEIKYTGQSDLQRELENVRSALDSNNAGLPEQAFWTAPSPGTLAMFFDNGAPDVYPTYEEYVHAVAGALAVEYRMIVEHGFTLQVDCPDLAMSRHTKFKHLGLMAWKKTIGIHIAALNKALTGIPRECVRIHLCWGNYSGTHHRDVSLREFLPLALQINARGFGFESANNRHGADFRLFASVDLPKDLVLYPGVVDTCSTSVESVDLVCERICNFAKLVGPDRVIANSDCGFSTTSEAQGLPTEVAWMKLRALVAGARKASHLFNPESVPAFIPRPSRRVFYFCSNRAAASVAKVPSQLELETRFIFTSRLTANDAGAVAKHIRLYVDVPVVFETDGSDHCKMFAEAVKNYLADGQKRNSPGYPAESLDKLNECLEKKDMILDTDNSKLETKYPVVVVGAGVVGLMAAKRLRDAGVDAVVLEKQNFVGGIWTTFANKKSQVNSSEGSYRVVEEYRARPNRDHSTTHEVRADILKIAQDLKNENRLFTNICVAQVEPAGLGEDGRKKYSIQLENGAAIECSGVVLAINDRVGIPRPTCWKNQENFKGQIIDGFGGDADEKNIDWAGKRVVIVGMGAFAIENARTALEHGASNVVVLARRHGTVCPKFIDYINFVNRHGVEHSNSELDTSNNSKNMFLWRKLYEKGGCTMPECWLDLIKHPGHTISVSDVWFVGHYLGKLETRAGEIDQFVEDGIVVTGSDDILETDIVVRCTGFERNACLVPNISPYTTMSPINYLDENVMYLADAYIDDNAFNSFFGSSVVEMAKFYVMVFEHFFKGQDIDILKSELLTKQIDVQNRKWTDYISGAEFLVEKVAGIRDKANAMLRRRQKDFVETQTVEEYVAANKREWEELHDLLTQGTLEGACQLPYPEWNQPR